MLLLLLQATYAFATTFGPISVYGQVTHGEYVLHGKVIGAAWVSEDPEIRRPFTNWKVRVISQQKGAPLASEIVMRQPGGEIGEMGYHVAGSATFKEGEETFVVLQDSPEPGVYDVVGLSSGKYTVEKNANGERVVRNGLGMLMRNENGALFSPETFTALLKRVANKEATEGDKTVFLNKTMTHENNPALEKMTKDALSAIATNPKTATAISPTPKTESIPPPPVEESPLTAEEPKSSWWWYVLGGLAAVVAGAAFFRRK